MATPISQLSGSFVTYATTNLLVVVDVTDTSMAGSGTDKKLTVGSFLSNYSVITSPGSTSITTLGTVTTGVWQATAIAPSYLTPMAAAGASHSAGIVPDPGAATHSPYYVLGDDAAWHAQSSITNLGTISSGVWQGSVISPTYLTAMVASGSSHSAGIVPDPGASAGATKFLREDATWTADHSTATAIATGSSTARTLASRFGQVINVVDFGADPTGGTNSYSGIQAAINYAIAQSANQTVTIYFPAGSYIINQSLVFAKSAGSGTIWNGLNIIGEGFQTKIQNNAQMTELFRLEDIKYGYVCGFRFVCNGTPGSEQLGAGGWTSTGWTGASLTWTNNANNTAALSNSIAAVSGNYYQIVVTITGCTQGSLTVSFGGVAQAGIVRSLTIGLRATSTGNLILTPDSSGKFNGTVTLSLKQFTTPVTTAAFHTTAYNGSASIRFSDLFIEGQWATPVGLGVSMDQHQDYANMVFVNCHIQQAMYAGILMGDGVSANTLDIHFYNCVAQQAPIAIFLNAVGMRWHGGYVYGSTITNIFNAYQVNDQVLCDSVRSEDSNRFFWSAAPQVVAPVKLTDNQTVGWGTSLGAATYTYASGGTYPIVGSFAPTGAFDNDVIVSTSTNGLYLIEGNNFQALIASTSAATNPNISITGGYSNVTLINNTFGNVPATGTLSNSAALYDQICGNGGLNPTGPNVFMIPGPTYTTSIGQATRGNVLGMVCNYQANFTNPIAIGSFNQTPQAGFHQVGGSLRLDQISDPPAAPNVQAVGTTGSTTYYYKVVFRDQYGNRTNVSATATISNSLPYTSFTTSNFNNVRVGPNQFYGMSADVLRSTDQVTWTNVCKQGANYCLQMPDGQWSWNPWAANDRSADYLYFADQLATAPAAYTLPSRNLTGDMRSDGYATAAQLIASAVQPNMLSALMANPPTVSGWIGNGAILANATNPQINGRNTLSITSPNGTSSTLTPQVAAGGLGYHVPVMPMTTYTAFFSAVAGSTGRNVQVLLNVYDGSLVRTRQVFGTAQNDSTQKQLTVQITTAWNEVFVDFICVISGTPALSEFHYIGDIQLSKGASTTWIAPDATPPGTVITPTTSTFGGAVTAPLAGPVVTKTGAYTATSADRVILCSAASAGWALNLPAANTLTSGYELFIKKTDNNANAITVTPNGTDKIDGASTYSLSSLNRYLYLVCDGSSNWDVGGSNSLTDLGTGTPSSTTFLRGDASWSTAVTSVTFTGDGTVLSSTPSSAVTTSGTVTAALATQAANKVLSGPTSGGAVAPTFRSLVAGDIPSTLNPTTIAAGSDVAVAILKANSTQTHDLLTVETSTPAVKGGINSNYNLYGALAADVITGRLTLSSTDPLADGSAATTIYYLPYQGRGCITLYNTTSSQYENWLLGSSGVSLSLVGLSASTLYDIFIYNNSGTLTLQATAWTSSGVGTSTRATAITNDGGYWYLTGSQNKRYLGTIYMDGSTKANDSVTSRTVWNMHNRESKSLSWTFTVTSPNPFVVSNGSNTTIGSPQVYGVISSNSGGTLMQLPFCTGVANYSTALVGVQCFVIAPTHGTGYLGISTSSTSFTNGFSDTQITVAASNMLLALMSVQLGLGFGYLYALGGTCSSTASENCSFYSPATISGTVSC